MKKNSIYAIVAIIVIYVALSLIIQKEYILPNFYDILLSLKNIIFSKSFLIIVFTTIYRTLIGLIISFIVAIVLAFLAYFKKGIRDFLNPIYVMFKTIPNITYIIVALIWLGRNGSAILVSSLVVFPIFYNSLLSALLNIDEELIEVTNLYDISDIYKIKKVYLPLIRNDIITSLSNCCSLGFKVSIMAEILAQVKSGIGKELYFAKANFMMADIFAWTIIIILISTLVDYLLSLLKNK